MPKFCSNCGLQLTSENVKFCPECGENFSQVQEQSKLKKNKKKRLGRLGITIGIFSILVGGLIILYINVYPVTEILGNGMSLAQVDSLCGNFVVSALSRGACSNVHMQLVFGWVIAAVLIITGFLELAFS